MARRRRRLRSPSGSVCGTSPPTPCRSGAAVAAEVGPIFETTGGLSGMHGSCGASLAWRCRRLTRTCSTRRIRPPISRPSVGRAPLNSAIIGLHLASNAEDDRPAAASLRLRFRAAQVGRHFAIVDVLLVARLAAEPLLGGAERPAPDVVARVRWRRCQRHREYLLQIRILHRCRCYCTLVAARRARSSRYAFTNCDKADGSTSASLF